MASRLFSLGKGPVEEALREDIAALDSYVQESVADKARLEAELGDVRREMG